MGLKEYFLASRNTKSRENLLKHKFLYDMTLAAVRRNYSLTVFQSEVDCEGHDVILDDGDNRKAIQLKSVLRGGKADRWTIQKKMFRPDLQLAKAIGYDVDCQSVGHGGGVVLQEIFINKDDLDIEYYYTDFFIMSLFNETIIPLKNKAIGGSLLRIAMSHSTGSSYEKIEIPRSIFIKAASTDGLLGLMGLHNNICGPQWIHYLVQYLNSKNRKEIELLRAEICKEINLFSSGIMCK